MYQEVILILELYCLAFPHYITSDVLFYFSKMSLVLSKVPGAGVLSCISKNQSINWESNLMS